MMQNSISHLYGKIQSAPLLFQTLHHTNTLFIVFETFGTHFI